MSTSNKHLPIDRRDDASISTILSEIRQIIDEDPIDPRHRAPRSATSVVSPAPVEVMSAEELRSLSQFAPAVQMRPVDDDVLAELLEPDTAALGLAPTQSLPTIFEQALTSVGAPAAVETTRALDTGSSPQVSVADVVPAVLDTAHVSEEPIRSSEDVLAELARGLSFGVVSTPSNAPAPALAMEISAERISEVLLQSLPDTCSPSEEAHLTPMEAAAAAVAEVAAINAAAQGASQRRSAFKEIAATEVVPAFSNTGALPDDTLAPETVSPEALSASVDESRALVTAVAADAAAIDVGGDQVDALEGAVSAMLRPMVREWLDANMPRLVERALKEELGAGSAAVGNEVRRQVAG